MTRDELVLLQEMTEMPQARLRASHRELLRKAILQLAEMQEELRRCRKVLAARFEELDRE